MCYGLFIEHFDTLHLYCVNVDGNDYTYSNLNLPQTEWTDWADWELKERERIQNEMPSASSEKGNRENEKKASPITPSQIIYYGVPGCGKSNKIREQLKNVPEKNKVRVVFHPEYTNAEFIGQILPKVNDKVTYEFTPGPFTQIIKRAYLNPNEHFYLVIEEINRGNAAAIFGDTFQLLDRLKVGETDSLGNDPTNAAVNTFTEGWSQYFVQNDDINAYIREKEDSIQIGKIHFDSNTAIRLPPNLSILATMNTSDQNVFTLDNAFQRRFDMELVRNEFDLTQPAVNAQYEAEIDDTGIKWGKFWGWINAKITATLKGLSSTEDKRLGVWFVSNVNGIIDDKIFAEKVLKFLWDDVFKFKRPQIFKAEIDTLEKLINFFENPPERSERFGVFKDMDDLKAFETSPTL
jgi:5-methylcytosine-specific restriction endonuclease McrBC GTP-binding regulatory subunit McrB